VGVGRNGGVVWVGIAGMAALGGWASPAMGAAFLAASLLPSFSFSSFSSFSAGQPNLVFFFFFFFFYPSFLHFFLL
jgi:hypothetical protein